MSERPERRTRRGLVLACMTLGMFMVAIEATIVSTAMPSIVGKLGGFSLYSWVFTAFLLTQATTTVMFGKLADLYGRRPVLIGGIIVFLAGSTLCGFAWSMTSLIAFRLLQGLGAGSIQPVVMTLLGDLYAPEERAGAQGYISAVWGVSAIVGPLIGALIVQRWSWPWIFWVNLPIGAVTAVGLALFLHEGVERKRHALDLAGAGLFFAAISGLSIVLTGGGGWPASVAAGVVFLVAAPLFIRQERRTPEPMTPMDLWTRPLIAAANSSTLGAGMVFMGVTTFLPIYMQGVMGRSATQAGIAITSLALAWPLAATVSRRLLRRFDLAATARLGGVLIVVGALFFPFIGRDGSALVPAAGAFIIGAGMGLHSVGCMILVQSSVGWSQRGAATSSVVFSRTLGNMLGAALLGGVLNGALRLYARLDGVSLERVRHLLDKGGAAGDDLPALHGVLDRGLHATFWVLAALGLATAILARRVPGQGAPAES